MPRLFDLADALGPNYKYIATGHHARIANRDGLPAILRGRSAAKDQSYVLFGIERRYLARMMLPVGGYHKHEIRRMAGSLGVQGALKRAKPILLEPYMKVEVATPDDFFGDVLGDVSSRRGHVTNVDQRGHLRV
ncbi:hypothetical protein LCGC14_0291780, partial [marine sediment metagenome]